MLTMNEAATAFLANRRIAVTGVSRNPQGHGSNVVYQRLKERGYDVFAVNPKAETVEGDPCYPNLKAIPNGVDAVVIATNPERAGAAIAECGELGIKYVWMHRGPGAGSVDADAAAYARSIGIEVIDGGCPCMFAQTADMGHKIMKVFLSLTGNVPRRIPRTTVTDAQA